MSKWMSRGFESGEEQIAAYKQSFTRDFFLKSGETVEFHILDDESFNIRDHFVKGKGWFTCIQGLGDDNCPLCEEAQRVNSPVGKASNHFIFQVLDPRSYTDKNGEEHKDQVKIWRVGVKLFPILRKKASKYGPLTGLDIELSKLGSGQGTSYDVEVTKSEKKFVLPKGLELYNLEEALAPRSRAELLAAISVVADVEDDEDNDEVVDWRKA